MFSLGILVDGLQLYETVGGVGIGFIFCIFAVIYFRLNTKIKFVSIKEDFLELEYSGGEKAVFSSDRVELVENYDGSRYFAARIEGQNRNAIIDPKNFKQSDDMYSLILEMIEERA